VEQERNYFKDRVGESKRGHGAKPMEIKFNTL
jgi:hypothetical protein